MSVEFVTEYAVWGAIGGLVAVLVKDGCIELPRVRDKKLYLGSLTGVILGTIAGLIGDSNPFNAFIWGIGGSTIMQGFVNLAERNAGKYKEGK